MKVTISRADGSIAFVLNKMEQDTLEHAVGIARTALRQLKGIETGLVADGLEIDPAMVEELRSVFLALKCGACGAIDASKAPAAAGA